MNKKNLCRYCGIEYNESNETLPFFNISNSVCDNCKTIDKLYEFVSNYEKENKHKIFTNKFYNKNLVNENFNNEIKIKSFILAQHTLTYRVVKRTNRVKNVIDKIIFIRDYLYLNLEPIFLILDSIYIKKDLFWKDSGNLALYVKRCCFQEAVLKLREILMDGSCKYSVKKICNTLLAESKYIFKEQEIYEILEFKISKDRIEERYEPFDINAFVNLINNAMEENKFILNSMKDYRDNQFAHIGNLKSRDSSKKLSYYNLKRMFSLAKTIYDSFLFTIAPDKYTSIVVDPNIRFSHLNELSRIYKIYCEEEKKRLNDKIEEITSKNAISK